MPRRKYKFDESYPIVIKNKDFMFQWCCDCGLRHVHFAEIERGDKPTDDKVNLYLIRDDYATNYRKDYNRLKKEIESMPGKGCKKHKRKHTPIVSREQKKLFGAVRGGKKTKATGLSKAEAGRHLRESKGKKLPKRAKKRVRTRTKYG